jgi:hypothetical protein
MTDSHEVLAGVNEKRVKTFSAKGHFAASSWSKQASSWLLRSPTVSRRHLELVRTQGPTAAIQTKDKPVPKFTPHSTPFTSGLGLRRWWKKGFSSRAMPRRTPSETNALKKSSITNPTPQGTTSRSSRNARGDTNTKFRPNTVKPRMQISAIAISGLDINFVNNLKLIASTTSRCLCLRRHDAKNLLSMLTNPCLCKSITFVNNCILSTPSM